MRKELRNALWHVFVLVVCVIGVLGARAQYEWQDSARVAPSDTVKPPIEDTRKSGADSAQPRKRLYELYYGEEQQDGGGEEESSASPRPVAEPGGAERTVPAAQEAQKWLRRLLFRGILDATHIGAYAQYQLTSWDRATGAYGPVLARLTVYYLGSSRWQGRDAEWLQAVYEALDEEGSVVEFDLIVPSSSRIEDVHRVLYRVDRGEIKAGDLSLPVNQLDYDKNDRPVSEGKEQLRLFSGTYEVEVMHGSGAEGAEVTIYRAEGVAPLGIVQLGYGYQALTFLRGGSDAAPRFHAPPPPSR